MTRREEARALRDEGLLLREIGERMGVSRERARQLLSDDFQVAEENLCRGCGKEIKGHPTWRYCRKPCVSMEKQPRMSTCKMCGKPFPGRQGKRYCGRPCPYGKDREGQFVRLSQPSQKSKNDAVEKLLQAGAVLKRRNDLSGEVKIGWWLTGIYLGPNDKPIDALEVLERQHRTRTPDEPNRRRGGGVSEGK